MNGHDTARPGVHDITTGVRDDTDTVCRMLTTRLDLQLRSLDPDIVARLANARRQATRSAAVPWCSRGLSWVRSAASWSTTFATGTAVVFGMAIWLGWDGFDAPMSDLPAASPEAWYVLSANEDFDFYRSVDFLLWLENRRG